MEECSFNLLSDYKKKKYFIKVLRKEKIFIDKVDSWIEVEHNLPLGFSYRTRYGVDNFFEQLEDFVNLPRFEFFIQYNRKNKLSFYNIPDFRKKVIKEVKIFFGKGAKEILDEKEFTEKVNNLLDKQKEVTEQAEKDYHRYFYLSEVVDNLKVLLGIKKSYYSSEVQTTLKISKEDYNEKLKVYEDELKILCKKYPNLKMPNIYYEEIPQQLSFEDWEKENRFEVEECWAEEEKENFDGDFDNYLKFQYENYLEQF